MAGVEGDKGGTDSRIAVLEAALAESHAKNAELSEQIGRLAIQVELLTEQLRQNSSNSHKPPSSDGPGAGKGHRKPKPKSGNKPGGQKGHRGSFRQLLPPDRVDRFVELFPDVCLGCTASLRPVHDAYAHRYQQLDLRDHRPHLTEVRRHEIECPRCGARTRAAFDRSKIPASSFGPCLTAVVGLLTGVYHLSRRKAQKLLCELFGVSVSLGAVSAMEARASAALESAYDEARREVEHAAIKHTDATSWLRSGVLMSLWTLASSTATVYRIFSNGQRDTIRPFFGVLRGILVSDRASIFTFWSMRHRQICWSHLLRKFISFSERDGPAGKWGRKLLEYTRLVFEYWHGFKDGKLSKEELEFWLRPVRRGLEHALRCAQAADITRMSGSCDDILAHREALWTFVRCDGVEPTNNHAERELRAFVLWRKRSFGTQSARGERFCERIMTIAHTARKQGKDVLDFLVRNLAAHRDGDTPPRFASAT